MNIIKRIKLGSKNYYIVTCCEYINDELRLKDYKDNYYDGGDLSRLIEVLESKYNTDTYKKYGNDNWFMSDCLYIYDHIPFINGVGDLYISTIDNIINSASYITKDELDKYIQKHHIIMNDNSNFILSDERTWSINNE